MSELQSGKGHSMRKALPVQLKSRFSSMPWWKPSLLIAVVLTP